MSGPVLIGVDTACQQVQAVFTTRRGGAGAGPFSSLGLGAANGDDPAAVRANRDAVAQAAGFDASRAVALAQVHGAEVVRVGEAGGDGRFVGSLEGLAEADASVTTSPGVALAALGADCPVVLLWSADGVAVGAAHAGWRGLIAGVLEAAVAGLGVPPHSVRAAVGPRVGACCYPVDATLRQAMSDRFGPQVVNGDAVDLGLACIAALRGAGVEADAISVVGACTSCDSERFFSYRRDGAATGRQAGIVWIGESA